MSEQYDSLIHRAVPRYDALPASSSITVSHTSYAHRAVTPYQFVTRIEKRRLTRGVRSAVSRCGGSVWESNPPEPPKAPPIGSSM